MCNDVSDKLLGKFAPKPTAAAAPKKEKTVSRFDQAAKSVAANAKSTLGRQIAFCSPSRDVQDWPCTARGPRGVGQVEIVTKDTTTASGDSKRCDSQAPLLFPLPLSLDCPSSPADFFWDTPWGGVPPERQGRFTVVPVLPRGRLLGGSKLAALAAARKKKQEEQNRGAGASQPTDAKAETDKAVALLDKLTVKNKENSTLPTDTGAIEETASKPAKSRLQYRKRQPTPEPVVAEPEEEQPIEEPTPSIHVPNLRIGPSSFASTLCGDGNSTAVWRSAKTQASAALTEVHSKVIAGDPFAGPSPDDVVLRAQAKGKRAVHG